MADASEKLEDLRVILDYRITEEIGSKAYRLEPEVKQDLWDKAKDGNSRAQFTLFRVYGWFSLFVYDEYSCALSFTQIVGGKKIDRVWIWERVLDAYDKAISKGPVQDVLLLEVWGRNVEREFQDLNENIRSTRFNLKQALSTGKLRSWDAPVKSGSDTTFGENLLVGNQGAVEYDISLRDAEVMRVKFREALKENCVDEKLIKVFDAMCEYEFDRDFVAHALHMRLERVNQVWGMVTRILRRTIEKEKIIGESYW